MKRYITISLCIFLLPLYAAAQDYPKGELYGGFSYFRLINAFNFKGWNASITGNANPWFGVEADFSGQYGSPLHDILKDLPFIPATIPSFDMNFHSFLFGPKFSYRGHKAITPFGHFLVGASRVRASGPLISASDTCFSLAAGGGLDVRLNDKFALRAIQLDYIMTTFKGSNTQDNLRLSVGAVFRFGK